MARLCMGDAATLSRRRGEVRLMPKWSRIRPGTCGGRGASLAINRSGRLRRPQRLSQRGASDYRQPEARVHDHCYLIEWTVLLATVSKRCDDRASPRRGSCQG